jgi:uncharacterized caspase-like protein
MFYTTMIKIITTVFFMHIFILFSQNSQNEKRLALVIGNNTYQYGGNLENQPVNDASDISLSLETLGFEVIKVLNGTQQQMDEKISEFGKKTKNYSILLFFYSGYGVQYKGENFLIPTNANLSAETDVKYKCIPINLIIGTMSESGSKVNIIILDASHENPFEKKWSRSVSSNGMSKMSSPVGTIISYASIPGSTVPITPGRNGLYTGTLLKLIKTPKLDIIDLFTQVRKEVYTKSEKKQTTWESNSLMDEFYLKE